jgi:hypothetical protein
MTPTQPSERAMRCAEELKAEFSIGTFSQFCDDPADFDEASTEELATIIDRHTDSMADELAEALRLMLMANGEDAPRIGTACAISALAKYDAQKGNR